MSANAVLFLEFSAVYILLTWAFYLPMRAGQAFNAPVYMLAISSYFAAYAMREWGWAYGLALLGAIGTGTLVGFVPAIGFARTKGFALAIATIAVIFVVQNVLRNLSFLGGSNGFFGIPHISNLLPITLVIVLVVGFIIYRIDHSRLGRAIEVMRVHPDTAGALGGVNPIRLSILLQTIAGAICGFAGGIYPFILGCIYPTSFGWSVLLYLWTILFIGGQQTMWGVLVSAPLLWGISLIIPQQVAEYTDFIFGTMLIVILLVRPEGTIDRRLVSNIATLLRRGSKRLGRNA